MSPHIQRKITPGVTKNLHYFQKPPETATDLLKGNILLAAAHLKYIYVKTVTGEKSGEVLARLWDQDA